jgi:hypothetical protein
MSRQRDGPEAGNWQVALLYDGSAFGAVIFVWFFN